MAFAKSSVKFVAPLLATGIEMARQYMKRPAKKSMQLVRRATRVVPRNVHNPAYVSMRRSTNLFSSGLTAGAVGTIFDITLSLVQNSDLIQVYEAYRIRKVVMTLVKRIDAGNNGTVNNSTETIHAACDTSAISAPASLQDVGAYSNHKKGTLPSGSTFLYTFYPKAQNTIAGSGGVASNVGSYSKYNPWINLDSNGVNVPHQRLLFYIQSLTSASTDFFDFSFTIYFDCIRAK